MSASLAAFFYGTLMVPEIFFAVCYGIANPPEVVRTLHRIRPAVLPGFTRRRVRHADYPGVIAAGQEQRVRGVLVDGLTDANMARLNSFEGPEYKTETLRVRLLHQAVAGDKSIFAEAVGQDAGAIETGEEHEAIVYVYKERGGLEHTEWCFEEFCREKMHRWLGPGSHSES